MTVHVSTQFKEDEMSDTKSTIEVSRRKFLVGSAAISAGLALPGCQTAAAPTAVPAAPTAVQAAPTAAAAAPTKAPAAVPTIKAAGDETYVWLGAVTAIAFWADGQAGFQAACKSLGVKGEYLGPVEYDAVAQLKVLEELIARKPAGIMIFPADDQSLNEPMKRAMAAGIPVVVVNHDVNDPTARYGYVGPDNRQVGQMGGRYALQYLKQKNGSEKGNIAFMTTTNPAHGLREAGYMDILSPFKGIVKFPDVDEKSDAAYGLTVATQLIQAHPDLDLIIGVDATAGAATARALKETGKAGKIMEMAMDRDDDMLPYIKDGTILSTLAQNSFLEEWIATYYLYWLTHNTVAAFPDWKSAGAPQCPKITDTGVTLVTKDNVDFFFHKK
jgi:ribose transport system substrate-binding protein